MNFLLLLLSKFGLEKIVAILVQKRDNEVCGGVFMRLNLQSSESKATPPLTHYLSQEIKFNLHLKIFKYNFTSPLKNLETCNNFDVEVH